MTCRNDKSGVGPEWKYNNLLLVYTNTMLVIWYVYNINWKIDMLNFDRDFSAINAS